VNPEQERVLDRLAELSRELDAVTKEIADAEVAALHQKHQLEVGYARAWLGSEGSVEQRRQLAIVATADQRFRAEGAALQVRILRERARTIGTQIDVGRTLASSQRQQWAAEGTGQA